MSASGRTYTIFDGDKDMWAYGFMKGWRRNNNMSFDFDDAHDIKPMTYRASDESYVKGRLRERMRGADQVVILVGESTRYLYKYVRWEIDLALELNKPIIVVNLNGSKQLDYNLCPPLIRGRGALHIGFKAKILEKALNEHPNQHRARTTQQLSTDYIYANDIYNNLGI